MTKDYKPMSKKAFHKSLIKSVAITALIGAAVIGGGTIATGVFTKPQKEEFVMPVTSIATDKSANKPKGKIDLKSGYVHNLATFYYQLDGDTNSGNAAYDYNEQSLPYMAKPLKTSKPKIYVQGNKRLKRLTKKAMKVWQPEIKASLTDNPNKAQVVIKINKIDKNHPRQLANTFTNSTSKRFITLHEKPIKKACMDNFGLKMLLEHELGHAWGLAHDNCGLSIMSMSNGLFHNRRDIKRYKQIPCVTKQNRQMLNWMYDNSFWNRLFHKQDATLKQ